MASFQMELVPMLPGQAPLLISEIIFVCLFTNRYNGERETGLKEKKT